MTLFGYILFQSANAAMFTLKFTVKLKGVKPSILYFVRNYNFFTPLYIFSSKLSSNFRNTLVNTGMNNSVRKGWTTEKGVMKEASKHAEA